MDNYLYLNKDAETPQEVAAYYRDQAVRLACYNIVWDRCLTQVQVPNGYAFRTTLKWGTREFASYYLPVSQRGKGVFQQVLAQEPLTILTTIPCDLERALTRSGHPYVLLRNAFWDTPEYKLTQEFYGQQTAKRSGVPLMRHIDEGVWILHQIRPVLWENFTTPKFFVEAIETAYILHPLVQDDNCLRENHRRVVSTVSTDSLLLAMEYRNKANAYLSYHDPLVHRPNPGPLLGVRDMLIADKVQNRKDFERYHKGTHPRSDRLEEYFGEWLDVLGVPEMEYQTLVSQLDALMDFSTISWPQGS